MDQRWLELSVECDLEAVEPVSELFARYGFNQGVAIEEPFTQEADGDNIAVDPAGLAIVRTFLASADARPEDIETIRQSLWHLGQMRRIGDLQVTERQEEDWANAWKVHFSVHKVGARTTVRAPWHDAPAPEDGVSIVLDPGMAFGTGLHPTTRLCMLSLEEEIQPGLSVLDVGVGSGVLAIAAAMHGAGRVDAVDIEPVSVRAARENVVRNGLEAVISVEVGSTGADQPFTGQYDLVLANIIARVLIELAESLAARVAPGGALLLSGVIESKEPAVRRTFDALDLVFDRRNQMEDWVSLVYRRPVERQ